LGLFTTSVPVLAGCVVRKIGSYFLLEELSIIHGLVRVVLMFDLRGILWLNDRRKGLDLGVEVWFVEKW
jgi:hypothetical protein